MLGVVRGCGVRLVILVLLVGGLAAAWRWGGAILPDEVRQWTERLPGMEWDGAHAPSAEDAAAAVARYETLVDGEAGGEVRLDAVEVTAALRYRVPDAVPDVVAEPAVDVRGDEVVLSGYVPLGDLPRVPGPDQVRDVLPETVRLELRGPLVPLEEGTVGVVVRRMDASGVRLPGILHPPILEVLGRPDRRDLPSSVLPVPLPEGVDRVFVDGDAFILGNGG